MISNFYPLSVKHNSINKELIFTGYNDKNEKVIFKTVAYYQSIKFTSKIEFDDKYIYNLIEVGKNGTKTTLTVNSFKTNEPLSKTLFTFDANKYQDYYINNLD